VIDVARTRYYKCSRPPFEFGTADADVDQAWKKSKLGGVQMYPLEDFIEAQGKSPLCTRNRHIPWYYERIGIRRLRKPLTEEQIEKMV
jgi:hypothetical protein